MKGRLWLYSSDSAASLTIICVKWGLGVPFHLEVDRVTAAIFLLPSGLLHPYDHILLFLIQLLYYCMNSLLMFEHATIMAIANALFWASSSLTV